MTRFSLSKLLDLSLLVIVGLYIDKATRIIILKYNVQLFVDDAKFFY